MCILWTNCLKGQLEPIFQHDVIIMTKRKNLHEWLSFALFQIFKRPHSLLPTDLPLGCVKNKMLKIKKQFFQNDFLWHFFFCILFLEFLSLLTDFWNCMKNAMELLQLLKKKKQPSPQHAREMEPDICLQEVLSDCFSFASSSNRTKR